MAMGERHQTETVGTPVKHVIVDPPAEYRTDDGPVNGEAPAPLAEGVTPAPLELSRAEVAGYRAGRMAGAAFQALAETFQPQVAAQLALDLTKTVLASPSGARILEE
jgi:hypothetical protein